ncbi:hypothetical protein N2152v2_008290 [Parachlorella kessleri]
MAAKRLALLAVLALSSLVVVRGASEEDTLLLEFKGSLVDSKGALRSWQPGTNPCKGRAWAGVTCSGSGRVVAINLSGAGLGGTLSASLGGLTSLQELSLANNQFEGPLPLAWASLGSGQAYLINLSGNQLTGTLPSTWGVQTLLFHLRLSSNALEGTLPVEWGRMRRLLTLHVSRNRLSGTLPAVYATMSQVTLLDFSFNALEGTLPPPWGQLASLQVLGLQSNRLSGLKGDGAAADSAGALRDWQWDSNPCWWRGVTCTAGRVSALKLGNLGLSGLKMDALDKIKTMEALDLSGNSLAAPLPALSGLSQLRYLNLSRAEVTGALPGNWSLPSVFDLNLAGNALTGSLPLAWAQGLPQLEVLSLADNQLKGGVPSSWSWLPLSYVDLRNNLGICGGMPSWQSSITVHLANTNSHQSCLLVHASGVVVGMVFGTTVVVTVTCLVAITALVIYIRTTKTTLREVLQERSVVSLASFLTVNNSTLPSFLNGYPSNPAMMNRLTLKLAAFAQERGHDMLARRGYQRLFRNQSDDSTHTDGGQAGQPQNFHSKAPEVELGVM